MVKYREVGTGRDHAVTYEYDEHNNLSSLTEKIDGVEHITGYDYDEDNRVIGVGIDTYVEELEIVETLYGESYTYDDLGRLEGSTVTNAVGGSEVLEKSYTFRNPTATTTSTQIATNSIQATIGQLTEDELYYDPDPYVFDIVYSYTYDDNGNILSISDGTYTTSYVYDSANQLIRENNEELEFTRTWEYDNSGNILYRREYAYTTGSVESLTPTDEVEYLYENENLRDLLTEYDGTAITHDAIGNPLNDGKWTYTWEHGRELASMSRSSYNTWTFAYDANGMRTRRTHADIEYQYVYNGSQLTQLTVLETGGGALATNTLYFTYSADGTPLTVTSEGETYFYVTNIQGDVIAILDDTGRVVCRYIYDAWGNVTTDYWQSVLVSDHNPLRYRGYVYDWETELYYLQSRYYNPKLGRFLNADAYTSTGQGPLGNNMFAYCGNNPVNYVDNSGMAYQAVGAGLQLEINIGAATVGLEVICYWDVDECQAGGAVIAVYAYGGISVDVNDPLLGSILAVITDNSSFLTGGTEEGVLALAMMLGTNFSISVSGVLIFGNERFSSTESYEGSFTSIGGSVGRLKGSVAYADSCTAVSIGGNVVGSNIIPSWGVSKTYYEQIYEKAVGVKSTTNTSNPCSGGCSKVTSGGGRLTLNMVYIV